MKIQPLGPDSMRNREISFLFLQSIIPTVFALLPVVLTAAMDGTMTQILARLADGTLVLIAFTMLISLSQDLKEAVRPHARQLVERVEMLLRNTALIMIAVFTLYQALAVRTSMFEALAMKAANGQALTPSPTAFWLEVGLAVGAFVALLVATYTCKLALRVLRPHFNDRY